MPELGPLVAPAEDPTTYPGTPVAGDTLLAAGWAYPLAPAGAGGPGAADLVTDGSASGNLPSGDRPSGDRPSGDRPSGDRPSGDRPSGDRMVDADGGPLGASSRRLSEALDVLGAAPMPERVPVLAVGSNASAAQLAWKYRDRPPLVLPLTAVTTTDLAVGFSAHAGAHGYLPYAPYSRPGARTTLYALWLDPNQLAHLDATEPNYERVQENGYGLYRGRWGVLAVPAGGPPTPATTQDEVYRLLAGLTWFAELVPEAADGTAAAMAALVADERRRLAVRAELASRGHAVPDGLSG